MSVNYLPTNDFKESQIIDREKSDIGINEFNNLSETLKKSVYPGEEFYLGGVNFTEDMLQDIWANLVHDPNKQTFSKKEMTMVISATALWGPNLSVAADKILDQREELNIS